MIGFATTIVNKTYLVSASSVTTEAFATNTNLLVNCQTFTFEYKKNGTVLGLSPTWLTYNSASRAFTYSIPTDFT